MKMLEQFLPFGAPHFGDEEIDAVVKVLRSGWVGMGPETAAFERELAAFMAAEHVIAVNSCTSALFLSLCALGVGPGDEVIVPSLTWCSTANAALYLGATPVFCDVEKDSLSASPDTVRSAVTERTKAFVHVHFGGLAASIEEFRTVLPESVAIVEDAAHALGSRYPDGSMVGSSGNYCCLSFYANKNLSTGEGGAIAVSDKSSAERLRALSHQGLKTSAWARFVEPSANVSPEVETLGYKMNFTDLNAVIGRVQLRKQEDMAERRASVAARYHQRLSASSISFRFQSDVLSSRHAKHLFVVLLPEGIKKEGRDRVLNKLRSLNVGASIHYFPLHLQQFYQQFSVPTLPNTEYLAERIITLPIGPRVSDHEAEVVVHNFLCACEEELGGK